MDGGVLNLASVSHTSDGPTTDELISKGHAVFHPYFHFPLDDWQLQAGGAICSGYNVIVCAPTGAGKTVVGEMALLHAFHVSNQNGIYTTPLKALSNQKFTDLCRMFGRDNTGLSTGDITIHKDAKIRVMTTEVYRNIAWRSSTPSSTLLGTDELSRNAVVVLDEFHYMGFPGRGGVWEESVITSPYHTQIVGLSATLANGQALASWMESVTERKTILVEVPGQKRPVPLRYLYATKKGLYPLFRNPDAGPGAPKGLLGYQDQDNKKGFMVDEKDKNSGSKGMPKGLQVNPALRAAARDRLQKVTMILERRKRKEALRNSVGVDISFNNRKLSPREERREKERLLRNEMRREVPSLPMLLSRLKQKDLLPAIFFIFSRVGCDEAARNAYQTMKGPRDPNQLLDVELDQFDVENNDRATKRKKQRKSRQRGRKGELAEDESGRIFRPNNNFVSEEVLKSYLDDSLVAVDEHAFDESTPLAPENWEYCSKAGLLEYDEVRQVASRIAVFNQQNPEIALDDEISEQLMFGVGAHHAGMLPAHKSLVEILFRNQLMKAVFATETLGAGINMPARTTAVCAMAKRGGSSSMSLLDTSNLLQMAGRAGRRGYDTEGTCVLVATPFENHDDARKILTDPVKPIESQFTPSYSLAVNLIARGEGKLQVARQLVSKSFAAWGKRNVEERMKTLGIDKISVSDVLQTSVEAAFMSSLIEIMQDLVNSTKAKFKAYELNVLLQILTDRKLLKQASKLYMAMSKSLELEEVTLKYLALEAQELEARARSDASANYKEDSRDIANQITLQRKRMVKAENELNLHPFTTIASLYQTIVSEHSARAQILKSALSAARGGNAKLDTKVPPLLAGELTSFAKSTVVVDKKTRRLANAGSKLDPISLLLDAKNAGNDDSSWTDMLSIAKTLLSYGCMTVNNDTSSDQALEAANYTLTPAGVHVGMLGFENSLWALVAMGGAWCVEPPSELDRIQDELDSWDDYEDTASVVDPQILESGRHRAEIEAAKLVSVLCEMEPAEVAGYVSAIVSENSRNSATGNEVMDLFRNLGDTQQRAIQSALLAMDRLTDVQASNSVDSGTRMCNFDISNVHVVTAWAGGCTWNEALQLSGSPPGDLVRTLSRVLDAVRQLGNLPYEAIRKNDLTVGDTHLTLGIHPEVRRLCREAAIGINRYPVKDPLAFETPVEEASANDESAA